MGMDWDSGVYHAACQWKNTTNQTFADSASLSTMMAFQQQDGSKSEKKRKHIWEWFAEQKRDSTLNWCPQAKPKQRFKRTQNPSEYTHSIFYISLKCNFILCCSSAYFSSIPSMRLEFLLPNCYFQLYFRSFSKCFIFSFGYKLLILCYYEETPSLFALVIFTLWYFHE